MSRTRVMKDRAPNRPELDKLLASAREESRMSHTQAIIYVLQQMPYHLIYLRADVCGHVEMGFGAAGYINFTLVGGEVKRVVLDAMIRKARG